MHYFNCAIWIFIMGRGRFMTLSDIGMIFILVPYEAINIYLSFVLEMSYHYICVIMCTNFWFDHIYANIILLLYHNVQGNVLICCSRPFVTGQYIDTVKRIALFQSLDTPERDVHTNRPLGLSTNLCLAIVEVPVERCLSTERIYIISGLTIWYRENLFRTAVV